MFSLKTFSLRFLLCVVTLVAILTAGVAKPMMEHRAEFAFLDGLTTKVILKRDADLEADRTSDFFR